MNDRLTNRSTVFFSSRSQLGTEELLKGETWKIMQSGFHSLGPQSTSEHRGQTHHKFFFCFLFYGAQILIVLLLFFLVFTPSTSLLHCPSPIPGVVSTGIIFAFTYMCTHFFVPYSPL
jgi:hypothetical protein